MRGVRIRPFEEADASVVAELSNKNAESFQYSRVSPEFLVSMVGSGYQMFVAEKDGSVVAFCGVNYRNNPPEIGPICVSSGLRRRGIGRSMFRVVLDFLTKKQKCVEVIIKVKASNTTGQAFFRSLGFLPIGDLKINGEKAYIMAYNPPCGEGRP